MPQPRLAVDAWFNKAQDIQGELPIFTASSIDMYIGLLFMMNFFLAMYICRQTYRCRYVTCDSVIDKLTGTLEREKYWPSLIPIMWKASRGRTINNLTHTIHTPRREYSFTFYPREQFLAK